jgi:hypothetical protein
MSFPIASDFSGKRLFFSCAPQQRRYIARHDDRLRRYTYVQVATPAESSKSSVKPGADVAQLAEQFIRNERVGGSNPSIGSSSNLLFPIHLEIGTSRRS